MVCYQVSRRHQGGITVGSRSFPVCNAATMLATQAVTNDRNDRRNMLSSPDYMFGYTSQYFFALPTLNMMDKILFQKIADVARFPALRLPFPVQPTVYGTVPAWKKENSVHRSVPLPCNF